MKLLVNIFLALLLIITTSGVNVSAHFCEGAFMDVEINTICFQTEAGKEMGCCEMPDAHCDHCRHIKCSFHLHDQFAQGQVVLLHPEQTNADWFHGFLPSLCPMFAWEEEIPQSVDFYYQSLYHTSDPPAYRTLRAPPVSRS